MAQILFGYELGKEKDRNPVRDENEKTFAMPSNDDGAVVIQSGAYYGTYVDLDGVVRNEIELITRYRDMSMQPELETAIDEIVNEIVAQEDSGHSVKIMVDDCKAAPAAIKKKIVEEFDYVLKLLDFNNLGHELVRRWYVDGRMFYHAVIDEKKPTDGIKEVRYIDPRRIRKIREIQKTKDSKTGIELISRQNEYYLYNERGMMGAHSNLGAKIAVDSVINVNSGLMDAKRSMVLSYLHKAIKPLNNLRMMEDAAVIYRLSRAPERRIFYIDVGNMSTQSAKQYLQDISTKYRNKLVYDSNTGEIKDDRKHLSMLEDFWLPRREGSRGTEITTLPGGQNLGKLEDVEYFEKKLYKSLGIPLSRLEPQQGFSLGRSTEITRDEIKFNSFVKRLRAKFANLFDDLLQNQLVLKKVCTKEEWKTFKEKIWYDFNKDNEFDEMKKSEVLTNRLSILGIADPFVGRYYSIEWLRKEVLHLTDEEIAEIDEQIENEKAAGKIIDVDPATGMPMGALPPGADAVGVDPNQPMPEQQPLPPKFQAGSEELEFSK